MMKEFFFHPKGCINIGNIPKEHYRFLSDTFHDFVSTRANKSARPVLSLTVNVSSSNSFKNGGLAFGRFYRSDDLFYIRYSDYDWVCFSSPYQSQVKVEFTPGVSPENLFYIIELLIGCMLIQIGCCFIHASVYYANEKTIINAAWGGSGKTYRLLSSLFKRNHTPLSDDLIIVDRLGNIYPYPKPANLLYYNLDSGLVDSLSGAIKVQLFISRFVKSITPRRRIKLVSYMINLASTYLDNRSSIKVKMSDLDQSSMFSEVITRSSFHGEAATLNFLLPSIKLSQPTTVNATANECAVRMHHCMRWERSVLFDIDSAHLFAFPEMVNEFEVLRQNELEIMQGFFNSCRNLRAISYSDTEQLGRVSD